MKLLGKKEILGLDIGASSIKIVQVRGAGEGMSLINFAYKEIPYSQRSKDDLDDFIINSIKEMRKEAKLTEKRVSVNLSGSEVSVHSLTLPKMGRKDLENTVKLELRRALPFDIETAFSDFYIREELPENKLGVMAVAVSGKLVKTKIKIIEASKLSPGAMNIAGYASENLINQRKDIAQDEVLALLDIGAKLTIINIFRGKKLQFTREITTAGDSITQVLVKTFIVKDGNVSLDFEKAEELKKEAGIPKEEEKEFNGIPGAQVSALIRPVLERLTNEVKRSLGYFRQVSKITKINRILLSGGGSKLKELPHFLTEALGIKTERFEPLKTIKIEHLAPPQKELLGKVGVELTLAIGLALEKKPKINLLPGEFKIREKINTAKTFFILGFSLIFSLLILLSANLILKKRRCVNLLAKNKLSISSLEPALKELKEFELSQSKVSHRKSLLEKAIDKQPFLPGILKEISFLIPEDIVLTNIAFLSNIEPKGMRIKGLVFASHSRNLSLSKFLIVLEDSLFFEEVRLISIRRSEGSSKPKASFELTLQLVY
ncbi:MAG: type IV pilus assembly protein PilM [Candidatus Omnitrophica bacterium]|nr:type IV pilus assembly protein PilM [Candidatus Omnitrophota bacterium]